MQVNGDEARASRLAARAEGIDYTLAGKVWHFPPEIPLDTALELPGLEEIDRHLDRMRWWTDALLGVGTFEEIRSCHHDDGSPVSSIDISEMVTTVLTIYTADEEKSSSSDGSPATPGESSSGIASAPASSRKRSGKGRAVSGASGASS